MFPHVHFLVWHKAQRYLILLKYCKIRWYFPLDWTDMCESRRRTSSISCWVNYWNSLSTCILFKESKKNLDEDLQIEKILAYIIADLPPILFPFSNTIALLANICTLIRILIWSAFLQLLNLFYYSSNPHRWHSSIY